MSYLNNTGELRGTIPIEKAKLVFPTRAASNKLLVGDILKPLLDDGGIVFENTPMINVIHSAAYNSIDIPHSNYDYHAFNKSSIQEIQLNVVFTATTKDDADRVLAVIHFLRTFTKMNFGINDPLRGLPPQIFRFSAYGDYAFNRVPVAIRSVAFPWTNDADMVHTSHNTAVPSYYEGSISLIMMPTPNKVRSEFSLDAFAKGDSVKKGYI